MSFDHIHVAFTNGVTETGTGDENFIGAKAAFSVSTAHEQLRADRHKRSGKHCTYGWLCRRRKHVDNSVYRFGSRVSVQCSKHKKSHFSSSQCQANCLKVAHFTDEY